MKFKRSMKVVLACALSLALVFSSVLFPSKKYSDFAFATDNVANSYESAKAQVAQCRAEYDSLMAQALEINGQIEQTASEAMQAQAVMVQKQKQLRDIIKYEYVNSVQSDIITTLLDSEHFSDFLKNIDYGNSIVDYQYRLALDQRERKEQYEAVLKNLKSESSKQNELLAAADKKVQEASSLFESIRAQLSPAQLAELEGIIPGGSTGDGGGGDEPSPTPDPGPTPVPGS